MRILAILSPGTFQVKYSQKLCFASACTLAEVLTVPLLEETWLWPLACLLWYVQRTSGIP